MLRPGWFVLGCLILIVGGAGCAGVPIQHLGKQGLFQKGNVRGESFALRPRAGVLAEVPATRRPSSVGFSWPLTHGQVSSYFGHRHRDFHVGLDLRVAPGTPVYAARGGVVVYSNSRVRGYGNLIVVKHDSSYATVYAHNRKNLVRRGQRVQQGQMIATVGATGRATGPHLHFEVRFHEKPLDPLVVLPPLRVPSVASAKY